MRNQEFPKGVDGLKSLGTPGVDNAWPNRKATTFDDCFNLHFVAIRDIAQPWQVKIY